MLIRLVRFSTTAVLAGGVLVGCRSHARTDPDPAVLSALRADVRLVGSETTWVTHGRGYELVGRTKSDLATVQPVLDRAATYFAQIYPRDSLLTIVAAIRRAPAAGKPFVTAAPVPTESKGERVELVIVDPKAMEAQRKRGEGPRPQPVVFGGSVATPAVRSWLSARAAHLTRSAARLDQLSGESEDPRVPAWAIDMVSNAGNEEMIDNWTKSLGMHSETVIPLSRFLTMARPGPLEMAASRRGGAPGGGGGEAPRGSGRGGMGGGAGGIGGTGRRGGMGGGGVPGGGRGSPGGSENRDFPLQGDALFTAESAVLSKYFARVGADIAGELIDTQITEAPIEAVLTKHNMGTVEQMDADWRSWLIQRASVLNRE